MRTYVSVTLRNVNLHNCTHFHSGAHSSTHASQALTMEGEDTEERRLVLRNIHVLWSRVLKAANVGNTEKEKATNKVNVQKKPRGQEENERKCKRKKHTVESLHQPGINYAHFHVRFNRSP